MSKKSKRGKRPPVGTGSSGGEPAGKLRSTGEAGSSCLGGLRRFEPVSDELVFAAIERAERHREGKPGGVSLGGIVAHLGFVRSGWTTRQLRPRLDSLLVDGLLIFQRRHGLDCWGLTEAARTHLTAARQAGHVGELAESPQHREWRSVRTTAAERIDGLQAGARAATDEARGLLETRERVRSDAWLVLAARLGEICRQLGLATYYLYEWEEPDDAQAYVDDYKDPGDEQLDPVTLCWLRSLRQHRRTQRSPKLYEDLARETVTTGQLITVPPEMLSELRHGLHTVLGNVVQEISQITDCKGRERHPEWYSEPRENYRRTCALLDLIGWGEPKRPAALHLDLSKHRQAVTEALDVRLGVASDDLKEADEVDTERAERGEPPKQEQTTQRVRTLREFATAVNDLAENPSPNERNPR